MDGDHDGVRTVAPGDLLGRPGERGRRSAGARLGDEVLGGNLRQKLGDGRHQRLVREYQHTVRRRDGFQPRDRLGEQRLARHQRKELLWTGWRAQRPEARADTTGKYDGPAAHALSPADSSAAMSDELGGARVQPLGAERLGEEVVGAELHGARVLLLLAGRGENDARQRCATRSSARMAREHVEAAEVRHHQVEQDEADVRLALEDLAAPRARRRRA